MISFLHKASDTIEHISDALRASLDEKDARIAELEGALRVVSWQLHWQGVFDEVSALKNGWACSGCGSRETVSDIRADFPKAKSCCPERKLSFITSSPAIAASKQEGGA